MFDGVTPLAVLPPLPQGGQESFVAQSLPPGSHSITAEFSGNASFAASTSAPFIQVVNPAPPTDYELAVDKTAATLLAGQSATFTITAASISRFDGTVHFTCGPLPTLTKCTFAPATTLVSAQGGAFTVLTVTTTGPHAQLLLPEEHHSINGGLWTLSPFAFGMVLVVGVRRRYAVQFAMRFFACVLLLSVISCGGGGSTPPPVTTTVPSVTPAGTTSIVVTATGAATAGASPATPTQQLTINLTVQP